jgi:hypothetical protein
VDDHNDLWFCWVLLLAVTLVTLFIAVGQRDRADRAEYRLDRIEACYTNSAAYDDAIRQQCLEDYDDSRS